MGEVYPKVIEPFSVGVIGATGTVGQRFIVLLSKHPDFRVVKLGASSRSAGKPYCQSVQWRQPVPIPDIAKDIIVQRCVPEEFHGCRIIFSALDDDFAGEIESLFRAKDFPVFSNAKNFRRDPQVPLMVPLVNAKHIELTRHQQISHVDPTTGQRSSLNTGFIVTNANCSTAGLVVPLKALELKFGPINKVIVTTLQAISGAGYPGVPSLDIFDNVVPFISGEEEKIEWETRKILGQLDRDHMPTSVVLRSLESDGNTPDVEDAITGPIEISANTTRVPVLEGHTATVSVSFKNRPPPSPKECIDALRSYESIPQWLKCPSAPAQAIFVHDEQDRPQPRLDRHFQDGAGVNVGRVRKVNFVFVYLFQKNDLVKQFLLSASGH